MTQHSENMHTLDDLYVDTLKDLYDAEHQLIEALPKMVQHAKDEKLKEGLQQHLETTREQVQRLDQIFAERQESPRGKRCVGMQGLIREGEEMLGMISNPDVKDAAIIAAAQKAEHYEICGYGTAATFANQLNNDKAARLLKQSLDEEEKTDKRLSKLAEKDINKSALR